MTYPEPEDRIRWGDWWRGAGIGVAIGLAIGIMIGSIKSADAYDKSICGMEPAAFERMWFEESGERIVFGYVDRLGTAGSQGEMTVIKYMLVSPETKTWTLVFQAGNRICTMRNGDNYAEFTGPVFGE